MMLSFLKFVNFLNNKSFQYKISDEKIERLHQLLFQTPEDFILDSTKLRQSLEIPHKKALLLLEKLITSGVLAKATINCQHCGNEIDSYDTRICPHCFAEIELEEILYVKIRGVLQDDQKKDVKRKKIMQRQAEFISLEWEKSGYIAYLLLDLTQSELLQMQGDDIYKETLDIIRDIVFKYALDKIEGKYLLLGEIGDCFKIALTKPDDTIVFINEFSTKLRQFIEDGEFPEVKMEDLYFPCFNAVANTIELPQDSRGHRMSPRDIIFTTLNGAIDFNSLNLTTLFRLDSKIKLNYPVAFNNNNLCLWLFDDLNKKLLKEFNSSGEFHVGKHQNALTSKTASLLVFPNGIQTAVADSKDYLESTIIMEIDT